MAAERLEGIIIKTLDYDDTDKIVTLLTDSEVVSFIALGVRKLQSKNRVALQLGNHVEVEVFRARLSNKLSKLKRANLISQPPITISDTANVIMDIMKQLKRLELPSALLYYALLEGMKYYGENYNHWIKSYVVFRIFDAIGAYPTFDKCIECNRYDEIVEFDITRGGFLCNLHNNHTQPLSILKAWKAISTSLSNYIQVEPQINEEIYKIIISTLNRISFE